MTTERPFWLRWCDPLGQACCQYFSTISTYSKHNSKFVTTGITQNRYIAKIEEKLIKISKNFIFDMKTFNLLLFCRIFLQCFHQTFRESIEKFFQFSILWVLFWRKLKTFLDPWMRLRGQLFNFLFSDFVWLQNFLLFVKVRWRL